MSIKYGFIGVGNMAGAIISGMLNSSYTDASNINLFDIDIDKCQYYVDKGANLFDDINSIVKSSDVIILAIKPQVYPDVLTSLSVLECSDKVFVSIAAGISIEYIRTLLKQDVKVVRVMPNTPLLLSKGASAICASNNITQAEFDSVFDIFSLCGVVEIIDEKHMNEIISINGSSPAYIYDFAKVFIDYADSCGIDKSKALNLFCATLEGSAAMIRDSGDDIDTLIRKVSSPGGTTIVGLNSLKENNFQDVVKEALIACTNRADELGK